ncbi:MAG: DNA polymerase III subunit delta' [Methylococcales bacterium]|nr:DNA polymerase III subunit delta' [Methylococcales bacterium]
MMMHAEILPWHHDQWQILNHYFQQNRIPQALMIKGSKGLGKQRLAHRFANALLCSQRLENGEACQQCKPCKLFKAATHPDCLSLAPKETGKMIGIDAVRVLIEKLSLKPQFEMMRVVLIYSADKLNNAAANAFLKCLEEPNERTCFILMTESSAKLPATILSRCQKMTLTKPDTHCALDWLYAQDISPKTETLLNLAQGAPLLAKTYFEEDLLTLRENCFEGWLALSNQQKNPIEIAEQWAKHPLEMLLNWLISWVTDLTKCHYHAPIEYLSNPDYQLAFQGLIPRLTLHEIHNFYQYLLIRQQDQDTQINPQIMFEALFVLWSQLTSKDLIHAR